MSYNIANFSFESELITVRIDENAPEVDVNLDFYYATIGYQFSEKLFCYGSFWFTRVDVAFLYPNDGYIEDEDIYTPTIGFAFDLNYRVRFKGQYARVRNDERREFTGTNIVEAEQENFNVWQTALSVYF